MYSTGTVSSAMTIDQITPTAITLASGLHIGDPDRIIKARIEEGAMP